MLHKALLKRVGARRSAAVVPGPCSIRELAEEAHLAYPSPASSRAGVDKHVFVDRPSGLTPLGRLPAVPTDQARKGIAGVAAMASVQALYTRDLVLVANRAQPLRQ